MNADPTAAQATRRLRKLATISAFSIVPASILAALLALTGERAGRCITYGENCGSNPGWLYQGSLLLAGVAWLTVLVVPRNAVSRSALGVQLAAEGAFLMAVVTTYA
ncbi:hypothetical protein [Streptomyces sp. NBC_01716]|uniref:hypothetical protein n=1 Tax=Streptomyces sp. NBC_01716 TaxID=2975917 RepID=UPI002E369FE7|nr:hypothetical protein [Streptomyces sp. NBC_01716]